MICSFRICWVIDMLYIFVEGPDDERYVNRVISPLVGECEVVKYATLTQGKINNFIRSINCMPSRDYLFLGDADGKNISDKKADLLHKYVSLDANKTYIVEYEIESWYYAGLSETDARKLKMKHYVLQTDTLTKEQFYAKMLNISEKRYIMDSILDSYLFPLAVTRNRSLKILSENIKKEP